jgi:hypothetical protein
LEGDVSESVLKWRVFYEDGSTFDSSQGSPDDAPPEGFVCSLGYDKSGQRYIMHGFDFYMWDVEGDQWWGSCIHGLMDRLRRRKVYGFIEGRTVTREKWNEIITKADGDPDFPVSGRT